MRHGGGGFPAVSFYGWIVPRRGRDSRPCVIHGWMCHGGSCPPCFSYDSIAAPGNGSFWCSGTHKRVCGWPQRTITVPRNSGLPNGGTAGTTGRGTAVVRGLTGARPTVAPALLAVFVALHPQTSLWVAPGWGGRLACLPPRQARDLRRSRHGTPKGGRVGWLLAIGGGGGYTRSLGCVDIFDCGGIFGYGWHIMAG